MSTPSTSEPATTTTGVIILHPGTVDTPPRVDVCILEGGVLVEDFEFVDPADATGVTDFGVMPCRPVGQPATPAAPPTTIDLVERTAVPVTELPATGVTVESLSLFGLSLIAFGVAIRWARWRACLRRHRRTKA